MKFSAPQCCIAAAVLLSAPVSDAFVPSVSWGSVSATSIRGLPNRSTRRYATVLSDVPAVVQSGLSLWIATIDSDIASIPENEFASVFAGGILVMFGGLFSALAVGFILEKRNLYANIVAESYAQGGDEEFWKGLSEEEKKKAESLLQQFRESKQEAGPNVAPEPVTALAVETDKSPVASKSTSEPAKAAPSTGTKKIGMFSDYGDD